MWNFESLDDWMVLCVKLCVNIFVFLSKLDLSTNQQIFELYKQISE